MHTIEIVQTLFAAFEREGYWMHQYIHAGAKLVNIRSPFIVCQSWRSYFQDHSHEADMGTGKNRIRRVMHIDGIAAQSLSKKYVFRGLATENVPNQLREEAFEWVSNEVVFSDMLEVKRADGTRVRGCFARAFPLAPVPLDCFR
jgi:hypothetical protein